MIELRYRLLAQSYFSSLDLGIFIFRNSHNLDHLLIQGYLFIGNVVFLHSDQIVPSIVQGDYLDDNSQSFHHVLEKLQPAEVNTDLKVEESKQETKFPPEGPQNPSVVNGTSYSLGPGVMPALVANQPVQIEGHEAQAHESRIPNFAVSFLIPFLYSIFPSI